MAIVGEPVSIKFDDSAATSTVWLTLPGDILKST